MRTGCELPQGRACVQVGAALRCKNKQSDPKESRTQIRRAVLVRAGIDVKHFPGNERAAIELRHEEPIAPGRTSWFYWRLELAGPGTNYRGNAATAEGNLAWSSPLWAVSAP